MAGKPQPNTGQPVIIYSGDGNLTSKDPKIAIIRKKP